jgi:hypothetical protein
MTNDDQKTKKEPQRSYLDMPEPTLADKRWKLFCYLMGAMTLIWVLGLFH